MGNTGGRKAKSLIGGVLFCFMWTLFSAGPAGAKIITIGMITYTEIHSPAIDGFKQGMAELGYIEGENVRYLYDGITETPEKIDAAIKDLLSQNVDLFLTAGNTATIRVKKAVEGMGVPILMTAALRPIRDGLVESLGRPGGNVTGVRVVDTALKTLEWLVKTSSEIKKVFIPFNPDDTVSWRTLEGLNEKAAQIGVELVLGELHSVEAAREAIEHLPEDMDAILRIPSPTFDMRNSELSRAAIRRRVPMAASLPLDDAVLLMCTTSVFDAGRQNARLAHLIFTGAKPSELPVETADPFLSINLGTAEKIGLYVPGDILIQAQKIIR